MKKNLKIERENKSISIGQLYYKIKTKFNKKICFVSVIYLYNTTKKTLKK